MKASFIIMFKLFIKVAINKNVSAKDELQIAGIYYYTEYLLSQEKSSITVMITQFF